MKSKSVNSTLFISTLFACLVNRQLASTARDFAESNGASEGLVGSVPSGHHEGTPSMDVLTDMQNPSAEARDIMDEDRDSTLEDYAAFQDAEMTGLTENLDRLNFKDNVNPQELFVWAWKNNNPINPRAVLAHADDLNIDPTEVNSQGLQVIEWASELGHDQVVELLLEWKGKNGQRVDPTVGSNYAIRKASRNDHAKVVELLLDWQGEDKLVGKRVDPTADYSYEDKYNHRVYRTLQVNHAILVASAYGHPEVVKLLLKWKGEDGQRVDPTIPDNLAIARASKNGYTEVVKLLLEWKGENGERVDPTSKRNYAIRLASAKGRTEVVKLLLSWRGEDNLHGERVDPTAENNEAIRRAFASSYNDVVQSLLNWRGEDGERVALPLTSASSPPSHWASHWA